jgi:hypothetical protein
MKYIKTYEILYGYKKGRHDLIPGNMYYHQTTNYMKSPVGYIGHNGSSYPLLCFIFNDDYPYFYFIDWIESLDLEPMKVSIKDYIIQNDIILKTIKDIDKKVFSSGCFLLWLSSGGPDGNGTDEELIKKFKKDLLSDERISILIDSEKYNL